MPPARTGKASKKVPASPSKEPRRRAPKRCRRCDGAPLLSECVHSRRKNKPTQPALNASSVPPPAVEAASQQETPTPLIALPAPPVALPQIALPQIALPTPPVALPASPVAPPSLLSSLDLTLTTGEAAPTASSSAIALTTGEAAPTASSSAIALTTGEATPTANTSSTTANNKKAHRTFPSNANPIYGSIKGLCRGNDKAFMSRTREVKEVFTETSKAQTFCEYHIKDIFTRIESLAEATGAWAYLAIQHPWSRSPFLHWTSRKLRREAPEQVQQLHKDVSRLMSQVKRADRARFMELVRTSDANEEALRAAEQRAVQAELEAELLREQLNERQNTLEARERVIAALFTASTGNVPAIPIPNALGGATQSA